MNDDRTMLLRVRAAAPLARVWQALTSPSQLEVWLAEHAEVDLPRSFTFWGRYTPDGELARQRLLSADDHTLRFIWTLGGEDTTVEIHVEPDGADASVVSVSQTHYEFQQALAESSSLSVIETFWSFSLGNLVDVLAGRAVGYRCDFTSSDLRAELEINAPRERIYQRWSTPISSARGSAIRSGSSRGSADASRWAGSTNRLRDQLGDAARIVALEPAARWRWTSATAASRPGSWRTARARRGSPSSRVGSARQGRRTPRGSGHSPDSSRCGASWRSRSGSPSGWQRAR